MASITLDIVSKKNFHDRTNNVIFNLAVRENKDYDKNRVHFIKIL